MAATHKPRTLIPGRLAEERRRAGISQEIMPLKIPASYSSIRKYESGERIAPDNYIEAAAKLFGVLPDYLRGKTACRLAQEQEVVAQILSTYRAYMKERKDYIANSEKLLDFFGFHFETLHRTDSHFVTVILTSKNGEQFELTESDFVELLESFTNKAKDVMLTLLHNHKEKQIHDKAAPGE